MPSRDRLRECDAKRAFDAALETYLRDHEELHRLSCQRREEELHDRLADDQPLTAAMVCVIDCSPELRQLFGAGVELPTPDQPGEQADEFEGLRFPTFFDPATPPPEGQSLVIDCPIGGLGRAKFKTDAAND
jgi:hypothetical protein